ncbi:MAG: sel1 repeat family protein [Alphaproteobacteria bacterium]|nr:sel1 repeat family protein [Alphaproteobacteria bacterium]
MRGFSRFGAAIAVALVALAARAPAQTLESARKAVETRDWPTARAELDALIQARNATAMVMLGRLHAEPGGTGPFAENLALACNMFERAANLNAPEGMLLLADCFSQGRGRPQDFAEARRLYQGAGDRGMARAWCAIGRQYFLGQGTAVDGSRGLALCRQGSSMGDGDADAEVGLRFLRGDVLTQSFADAKPWLERAAQRGNGPAARELGEVYWSGKGVPRDRVAAVRYFEQAARAGDLDAAWRYARYRRDTVFTSTNVPSDRRAAVDALYWLTVVGKFHPEAKLRSQAENEVETLRGLFPDLVQLLDHRLYNDPFLGKPLR